jgi:hypothetical protein
MGAYYLCMATKEIDIQNFIQICQTWLHQVFKFLVEPLIDPV